MAPPTDPQRAAPPPHLTAAAEALAGRLREDAAHADRAAALGRDALTRLGVFGGDFLPAGAPAGAYGRLCQAVGLGLLAHALPSPGGWAGMDAGHVEGYVEALRGDPVEAGRLIGAFGSARLAAFGRDLKLVHRVGGYLGRPGLPLADHLIAAVVRPAAESVARLGPPDGAALT